MNTEELSIKRNVGSSVFDVLRSEMIQKVQQLGAHQWTDYNLHDPGVTILEQLCYALTDINYRSQYSAKQILTNKFSQLDLHSQGLYTKYEALPSRPVSVLDLQKYLLDRVPKLASVDIIPVIGFSGLVDISLKACSDDCDMQALIRDVRECYSGIRNLCENLREIRVIPESSCNLVATITIEESSSAVNVLSQVYAITEKHIIGEVTRDDYETVNKNDPLGSHLDGPLLNKHYIADSSIILTHKPRPIRNLISQLKQISGVIDIDMFSVEAIAKDTLQPRESFTQFLPPVSAINLRLVIPEVKQQIKVHIEQGGQRTRINIDEFINAYHTYIAHEEHQRHVTSLVKEPPIKPSQYIAIRDYTTVQHQFPANYGINEYGVPAHSTTQRKAQAKQLKAYLLLFDQLMSDHLLMLDSVKSLFSVDINQTPSYPSQTVTSIGEPSLKALYRKVPVPENYLGALNGYDSPIERKHRALDYLYALNGRTKESLWLERKNVYYEKSECATVLLKAKQRALRQVHEFSANRYGASNTEKPGWDTTNCSYLERRLRLLLSLDDERRSLVAPLQDIGLQKKDDSGFHFFETKENQQVSNQNIHFAPMGETALRKASQGMRAVPLIAENDQHEDKALTTLLANPSWKNKQGKHCVWLYGTELSNYRMGNIRGPELFDLILKVSPEGARRDHWAYLGSFKRAGDAIQFANQIRYQTSRLNRSMEGLHLLEHIQLLPMTDSCQPSIIDVKNPEFYQHQISILLPNWTARFIDGELRSYLEDQIRSECPAHIYANVFWVGFNQMQSFEWLYQNWCKRKIEGNDKRRLNRLSAQLSKSLAAAQDRNTAIDTHKKESSYEPH